MPYPLPEQATAVGGARVRLLLSTDIENCATSDTEK